MNYIHLHSPFVCQTCPGHNRIRIAADDAHRILLRTNELLGINHKRVTHGKRQHRYALFHQNVHCSYMGGSCTHFQSEEQRLRQSEKELDIAFDELTEKIKGFFADGDDIEAKHIRQQAFNLFRGHYPNAARTIQSYGEGR